MKIHDRILLAEVLSDAEIEEARLKYSFDFTIDGMASRAWYDPNGGGTCFCCKKGAGDPLFDLAMKIELAISESESKSHLNRFDIRNFVCKHLQAMTEVDLAMLDMVTAKMREKMQ
jgi:hypothetical protein